MSTVIQNYSKIASSYETTLGSSSKFLSAEIHEFYRTLRKGSLVLDAGCGPGIEAEIGLNEGHQVMGLDLCPEMLERYQLRNSSSRTLLADISSIPLENSSVDAVFSSCAILHKNKAEGIQAIHEFSRVIRPSGNLFLVTSILDGKEELHTRPALQAVGVTDLYFYHWLPTELIEEVKLAGFKIEKTSQYNIIEGRPGIVLLQAVKNA